MFNPFRLDKFKVQAKFCGLERLFSSNSRFSYFCRIFITLQNWMQPSRRCGSTPEWPTHRWWVEESQNSGDKYCHKAVENRIDESNYALFLTILKEIVILNLKFFYYFLFLCTYWAFQNYDSLETFLSLQAARLAFPYVIFDPSQHLWMTLTNYYCLLKGSPLRTVPFLGRLPCHPIQPFPNLWSKGTPSLQSGILWQLLRLIVFHKRDKQS